MQAVFAPVSDRIFWQTAAEAETRTAQRQHACHVADIEDPEAWEKIYKLVNVLWLKEATYRTVELEKGVKKA